MFGVKKVTERELHVFTQRKPSLQLAFSPESIANTVHGRSSDFPDFQRLPVEKFTTVATVC
jgi:hypothetical protein